MVIPRYVKADAPLKVGFGLRSVACCIRGLDQ